MERLASIQDGEQGKNLPHIMWLKGRLVSMSALYLFLLACVIIIVWNFAGRYEWQIPTYLIAKINSWTLINQDVQPVDSVVLNIEAREFITDEMEKEIYFVKKSRKHKTEPLLMSVEVKTVENDNDIDIAEIAKAKLRLENRFPGVTVKIIQQEPRG